MKWLLATIAAFMVTAAFAVEPDEVLQDPLLEERARAISQGLRCLQCRNESIDESNADIARDLRILVRDRLKEGDSDTEVIDYVVDRFGEYVLLKPNGLGANLILWLTGPLLLLVTLLVLFLVRSRIGHETTAPLSTKEEDEIKQILSK